MKIWLGTFTLILLFTESSLWASSLADSLRTESRDGKRYVVHQVEAKETLFGISRRYQTTISEIQRTNPEIAQGLKIGQQIVIPLPDTGQELTQGENELRHLVDVGETLYAISRKYGVTVEDLKDWNDMTSNELNVGQSLVVRISEDIPQSPAVTIPAVREEPETGLKTSVHIVRAKETLYSISKLYNVSVEDLRQWNSLSGNELSIGQELRVLGGSTPPNTPVTLPEPVNPPTQEEPDRVRVDTIKATTPVIDASKVVEFNSKLIKDGALEKVLEEGMASVIANSTNTKKYLALHRTADIGTVMRVKNLINNLSIYVRVVGKLPGTGENEKLLLKISQTAYERLGAINRQFPVEVSYVP